MKGGYLGPLTLHTFFVGLTESHFLLYLPCSLNLLRICLLIERISSCLLIERISSCLLIERISSCLLFERISSCLLIERISSCLYYVTLQMHAQVVVLLWSFVRIGRNTLVHAVYVSLVFRQPRRSMTHVGNIFTYKSNVQHLTLTKINNQL